MPGGMILRRWASRVRTDDRAACPHDARRTGVSDDGAATGNVGFEMLLRDLGDGTTDIVTLFC